MGLQLTSCDGSWHFSRQQRLKLGKSENAVSNRISYRHGVTVLPRVLLVRRSPAALHKRTAVTVMLGT